MHPILPNTSSRTENKLLPRLTTGQRELSRIRFRLGAVLVVFGVLCGTSYEVLHFVFLRKAHASTCWLTQVEAHLMDIVLAVLFYGRIIFPTLAPLANDLWFTRLAMGIDVTTLLCSDFLNHFVFANGLSHEGHILYITLSMFLAADVMFICIVACAVLQTSAARMQRWMWRAVFVWVLLEFPIATVFATRTTLLCGRPTAGWWAVLFSLVTLKFVCAPDLQNKLRARLGRLFEARSAEKAAASIAGLVGSCEAKAALLQAAARFRAVSIADLERSDLAGNTPDPNLLVKTTQTSLRRCDAFVSHSWHDDSEAKWAAIQSWRTSFSAAHGREPSVWIDKCCIDQTCIDVDLRCLPIFLSGCRNMVVFCGPSYLTRLWCVIELFTFVHMGGSADKIHFKPVLRKGCEEQDLLTIRSAFDNFDAEQCTCFLAEDKERMLGIIHAAYGDLADFNASVRAIFREAGVDGADGLSWGAESSSVAQEVSASGTNANPCQSSPSSGESASLLASSSSGSDGGDSDPAADTCSGPDLTSDNESSEGC